MNQIKDKDVRKAVGVVEEEFIALEALVDHLERDNLELRRENENLDAELITVKSEVEELRKQNKELSEALAELHLTGDKDEG